MEPSCTKPVAADRRSEKTMIQVQDLTKYHGTVRALDGVSFHVRRGETVGLLGPNGAGKSTAVKILTGCLQPSSGTVTVAGYDLWDQPLAAKRHVGYLPENAPLYAELTVSECLDYAGRLKGIAGKPLTSARGAVVDRCGLRRVAGRRIGNLSQGDRQRVGLAQALIHNPVVLLLDEPTLGLDPAQSQETCALIRELAEDHTIVVSTHRLAEVTTTCQRIVIISDGRVLAVDTHQSLAQQADKSRQVRLRVARPGPKLAGRLLALDGVLAVDAESDGAYRVESGHACDLREEVARVAVESGAGLLELAGVDVSLEEVFLRLTREAAA